MHHVLIIEDDQDLSEITKVHLTHKGYISDCACTCKEARFLIENNNYDAILLDIILSDGSGDKFCKVVRKYTDCPVIFMSCLDDSNTIISSLKNGGDDYVVKPLNYEELSARLAAQIRRYKLSLNTTKVPTYNKDWRVFKSFTIDTLRRQVLINNAVVELSSIEYNLLLLFVNNPNCLLLYGELYKHVWGNDSLGDVRTVMVHISNLRKKIDPNRLSIIETVRGAGYIFSDI